MGDGPFKSFRFNKCLAQGHCVGPSQLHWPILRTGGGYGWLVLLKTVLHVSLVKILMWRLSRYIIKLSLQGHRNTNKLCFTTYSSMLPTQTAFYSSLKTNSKNVPMYTYDSRHFSAEMNNSGSKTPTIFITFHKNCDFRNKGTFCVWFFIQSYVMTSKQFYHIS